MNSIPSRSNAKNGAPIVHYEKSWWYTWSIWTPVHRFVIPRTCTRFRDRAFSAAVPREKNSFPLNIHIIIERAGFKRALRTHNHNLAYNWFECICLLPIHWQSVYLSIHRSSSVRQPVHPFACPSVCLFTVQPSLGPSVHPPVLPAFFLFFQPLVYCLSTCPTVHPSVHLSVHLPVPFILISIRSQPANPSVCWKARLLANLLDRQAVRPQFGCLFANSPSHHQSEFRSDFCKKILV